MKIGLTAILLFWYLPYLFWLACWLFRRLRRPAARVPTNAMVFPKP